MKKALLAVLLPAVLAVGAFAQEGGGEYSRWKLDFEYNKPANVVLKSATGDVHVVWYMTYKVTNNTDKAIPLNLAITAETDTDKTYRDSIEPLAQRRLEKQTGKKFKNAFDMCCGEIEAGKSIDAVAFFGEVDPSWDWLTVRVSGLVETIDKVEGKLYFEKKILVTKWYRPGDEFGSVDDEIKLKSEKWEIEGERQEIPQQPKE